jgi:hypothetical protein
MGAPVSDMKADEQPTAELLLKAFKTIDAAERRRHATVLNYWLSIRGDRELPPLHDLDPLEISDAAPSSILLELIGGGEDAEIRHLGEKLKEQGEAERIIDAPRPSLLACIASKLSIIAISRNALSFEDEFETADGPMRCWVTLLPLSSAGAWVDYVYGFASFDAVPVETPEAVTAPDAEVEVEVEVEVEIASTAEPEPEPEAAVIEEHEAAAEIEPEPPVEPAEPVEIAEVTEDAEPGAAETSKAPGFSKLIDSLAGLTGFYGSNAKVEPTLPPVSQAEPVDVAPEEPVAFEPPVPEPVEVVDEPVLELADEVAAAPIVDETPVEPVIEDVTEEAAAEPAPAELVNAMEGTLQSKLDDVRGKADEARMAKLQSNAALYDGLSAAYDFALDAEDAPEEYLKLVEAKGLKIQLRSPMTPVVKLAFEGMCDDATIGQLEAVLAWALEQDLPRGSLAEKIQSEGGIAPILSGLAKAA